MQHPLRPVKSVAWILSLVLAFCAVVLSALVAHAQTVGDPPVPCNAAWEVIVADQFGNPSAKPITFTYTDTYGETHEEVTENGEYRGCAPAGTTTFKLGEQEHEVVLRERVFTRIPTFYVTLPLPGDAWLKPEFAGRSGPYDSSYKFLLDESLLNATDWDCEISPTTNNAEGIHRSVCDTHFDTADYVSLRPGIQEVTIKATHRHTGTVIIMKKTISVPRWWGARMPLIENN